MFYKSSIKGSFQSVNDDEPSAVVWVSGHERFCEIIQASSVDDNPWPSDCVDEWASSCVAKHVYIPALRCVHERLADVTVDHELSVFENLRGLVLSGAMNCNL